MRENKQTFKTKTEVGKLKDKLKQLDLEQNKFSGKQTKY